MSFNRLTLEQKLLTKASPQGDCLIWSGAHDRRGYGFLRINGLWRRAHRLMYELHHGTIPDCMVVLHACDNPACIAIAHLSIGSQHDNVRDMLTKNRANKSRGEAHPKAKLTTAQVAEIRATYCRGQHGFGAHVLAKKFGVTKQAIQAVVAGKAHKEIP